MHHGGIYHGGIYDTKVKTTSGPPGPPKHTPSEHKLNPLNPSDASDMPALYAASAQVLAEYQLHEQPSYLQFLFHVARRTRGELPCREAGTEAGA